ncbi:hypothetical protein [Marinobacterium iners]|uniref:Uncharacterized protein n=1 Tax=Marinobacterium iners DSM 11526 TaxID=1122198 RepID=A0A1H4HBB8_9GAMM|nr:hypothetical protein [Marinobacterium iners]SEB19137.1 hypothetical protein SAMN02745729_1422 [Marinobacterium iners DSM 11526]
MKKEVATEIVDLMVEFGDRLNQSVAMVQKDCSEDELVVYRRAAGKLMGTMLLDIMNPIFDEHPDLKSDRLE